MRQKLHTAFLAIPQATRDALRNFGVAVIALGVMILTGFCVGQISPLRQALLHNVTTGEFVVNTTTLGVMTWACVAYVVCAGLLVRDVARREQQWYAVPQGTAADAQHCIIWCPWGCWAVRWPLAVVVGAPAIILLLLAAGFLLHCLFMFFWLLGWSFNAALHLNTTCSNQTAHELISQCWRMQIPMRECTCEGAGAFAAVLVIVLVALAVGVLWLRCRARQRHDDEAEELAPLMTRATKESR